MSANFTPELNSYTDLTPFRYWCQKVLPLVYDDSLSYYELLCKVIDYLNKTMEDVNLAVEDVGKLRDAYDSLQTYVNTYFDNLDVQEEINNKLDEMVEDGTIRNIFSEDVQDILDVASNAAQQAIADIPENVTNWLEEHITQETGYVIDDTLTVQGAAADAKKTGDEISALKSDLNTLYNSAEKVSWWEKGGLYTGSPDPGGNTPANNRMRTITYLPQHCISVAPLTGYKMMIFAYDANDDYVGVWQGSSFAQSGQWLTTKVVLAAMGQPTYQYRIVAATTGDASITVATDALNIVFDTITDETLTKYLVPADANVTGRKITEINTEIQPYSLDGILLEQGGISTSTGANQTQTTRVRTKGFIYGNATIHVPEGYVVYYAYYYDPTTLALDSYQQINAKDAVIGSSGKIARFTLAASDTTSPVVPSDFKRSLDLENVWMGCTDNYESIVNLTGKTDTVGRFIDDLASITLASIKAINTLGTWSDNTYTYNGITYTVNSDMSVSVSGTADGASSIRLYSYNLSSSTDVIVINPSLESSDDAFICLMSGNGSIKKYPKGVSSQIIPSGVQRLLIRIESGKTVSVTVSKVSVIKGAINDFLLKEDEVSRELTLTNYIPYYSYDYTGTILTPSQLKTEYSASNLLEAIYDFCDEVMDDYPNLVTKEELTYTGQIVDTLPDVSTVSNGDIVMVSTTGGYYQYIKDNGEWVQMYTWDNNNDPVYLVKLTYPMYAYTISPYEGCDYPVILWCSGLHGSEDWSNISTLYFFKELLANRGSNDDIDYLLSNFVIKIVPCCGVSACADRTLGAHAMSENGVNPNRDFPVNWRMSSEEWNRTGNYPFYDPYNRILASYLKSLTNVLYCINKHDSNSLTSDGFVNNIWDNFISANVVEGHIFKQLDLTIKARYTWLLSEFTGTGVSWTPNSRALCKAQFVYGTPGSFEQWYNSIGIKGGLIETVCKTGTAYSDTGHDSDFYRIALECDIMTLCAIAKNINTLMITDKMYRTF